MRKLFYNFTLVLFYLLVAWINEARATVLSACAAALAPGQFVNCSAGMINLNATAVPPGGFDNNPANVPAPGPGYDGPQPAWDTTARKLYIETSEHNNVANGFCPNAYPNYPHSCWKPLWTYDDATNTWTTNGPAPHYTGGQPVEGVHVWGMIAYDNINKTIYVKKHGWGSNATNNFAYDIFRYCAANSPASYCASQLNDWRQITQYNPASGDIFGQMGWMPTLNGGTLLLFDTNGNNTGCGALNSYREGVGWVMIDSGAGCKFPNPVLNGTSLSVLSPAVYSKTKNVTIFGPTGTTTARQWWRINSTGVIAPLDPAPCDFFPSDGGFNHMVDDPADTGDIIVIGCTHAGKMYRLNPTGAAGTQWTLIDGDLSTAGKICNVTRNTTSECGFDFYATPILTYGVIGFWKFRAGGTAEYWLYKTTASSSDITPPTVSITAPTAGATVSGAAVSVIATASDTVGVVGVQFKLDGVNLQSEDLVAPYAILWNSTTASNGSHTITATARDAAGNTATSTGVSITVTGGVGSDFATRCNAAGVFFCNGFDSAGDLGGSGFGSARGRGSPDGTPCNANNCPQIDTVTKVSGAGALKFTIPPGGSGADGGSYWANPSTDGSVRFGEGQTWYVQFRQRVTASYASAAANNNKIHWVSSRPDLPGCSTSFTALCFATCTENELVNQNQYTDPTKAFPRWYTGCPDPINNFEFIQPITPGQYDLEPGRTAPGCLYDNVVAGNIFPPSGNCFPFSFDQWVTWSYKITLGTIGTGAAGGLCYDASNPSIPTNKGNCYYGGQFLVRAGLDGQPLTTVLNWTGPMIAKYNTDPTELKYGKVFFAPYTGVGSVLPSGANMWFDELIMSTSPIADPGAPADTTNPTVAITSPIPPTTSTTTSPIAVSGTATDNISVTSVTWTCIACTTKGGTATSSPGTSISWTIPAIDLVSGTNVVNVVAHDAAGNVSTTATLTIAYTPSTTYWVRPTGTMSGCTPSTNPPATDAGYKSTANAGIACLSAGNTLMFRAGSYTAPTVAVASGTALPTYPSTTGATFISRYASEVVTWTDPATGTAFLYCPSATQRFIVVNGFILDGAGLNAGCDHVRFSNNEVKNNTGVGLGGGTFNQYQFNVVHNNGTRSNNAGVDCFTPGCGTPQDHGFYIDGPDNLVEDNDVYANWGCGIHHHAPVSENHRNIIRRNRVHGNGTGIGCAGILVDQGDDNQIYNNVVYGHIGGPGINLWSGNNRTLVYGNSVYNNATYQIQIDFGTNSNVRNNILSLGNGTGTLLDNGTTTTKDYQLCTSGCTGTNTINSVAAFFVSPGTADFHLIAGSPAINSGFALGFPYNTDIANTSRPQGTAYDIGAYEFIASAPPVVTIVNPTSNPTLGVASPIFSLGGTSNLP